MRSVSFIGSNNIQLLSSGAQFFPALIEALNNAQHEIFLETYIFALDETGVLVRDALQAAAQRGVEVYVVIDWIGTDRATCKQLTIEFLAADVHFRIFNPWFTRGLARSHRKLCVVDHALAFIGGQNINDDLRSDSEPHGILEAPRWDFGIQISGALVATIYIEMTAQWSRIGNMKLKQRWEIFRQTRTVKSNTDRTPAVAALVLRDNLRNRRTIQHTYLHALGHAHHTALLANPYFAPGRKLRRALTQAAQRGVKVTLLLGVGQFRSQDLITQSFYPKLLSCGVRIVEYRKTELHAKVAVIDDEWATVGSSNYDGLSLFINQEANVVIKDEQFCSALRLGIEAGIADGTEIELREFDQVPWTSRLLSGTLFACYRAAIRLASWSRYD